MKDEYVLAVELDRAKDRIRKLESELAVLAVELDRAKDRIRELEAELAECRLWHSAERTAELKARAEKAEKELGDTTAFLTQVLDFGDHFRPFFEHY